MKNRNPIFSLKNFRSFGEEGADFELAPITILTGCNSSGKSSLVKALILMSLQPYDTKGKVALGAIVGARSGMEDVIPDVFGPSPSTELKISSEELSLGRFDKVLNHYSNDGHITISYRMWSRFLQEVVIVKRVFKESGNILHDGELSAITIEKVDGTLIYQILGSHDREIHTKKQKVIWILNPFYEPIKENAIRFVSAVQYNKLKDSTSQEGSFESISDSKETIAFFKKKYGEAQLEAACKVYGPKILEEFDRITFSHDEFGNKIIEEDKESLIERIGPEESASRMEKNFFNSVVNECVVPWFIRNATYINSSSALVRRIYSVEDQNKLCKALRKIIDSGKNETGLFVNEWLKKFEIGEKVRLEPTKEGVGVLLYLVKGEKEALLADEGYGITQLISLLIQIENCIIANRVRSEFNPFYTNIEEDTYQDQLIAVEEPEIHLHPKYQSLLADMFVEASKYNIHFIIETHSEYLIRKLQVLVADKENELTSNDVSLNYVDRDEDGISTNRKIDILEDGRLSEPFGPGFFDEATGLSMHLLKMKMGSK